MRFSDFNWFGHPELLWAPDQLPLKVSILVSNSFVYQRICKNSFEEIPHSAYLAETHRFILGFPQICISSLLHISGQNSFRVFQEGTQISLIIRHSFFSTAFKRNSLKNGVMVNYDLKTNQEQILILLKLEKKLFPPILIISGNSN
jgi:hypothetical protein